jgi:hypothetical protein
MLLLFLLRGAFTFGMKSLQGFSTSEYRLASDFAEAMKNFDWSTMASKCDFSYLIGPDINLFSLEYSYTIAKLITLQMLHGIEKEFIFLYSIDIYANAANKIQLCSLYYRLIPFLIKHLREK